MDNVALFFHILGVLVFVAGIVLAGITFEVARRREQPSEILLLLGVARIGVLLVGAGGLLLGAFGLWLVHLGHFGYGSAWVDAAIVLYVLALALGGLGGQQPKHARRLASQLANDDRPASNRLHAILDDRRARAANYGSLALVLATLTLMIFH